MYPTDVRLQMGLELLADGFEFPTLVDQEIQDKFKVSLGRGVIVYNKAEVNPSVKMGDFVAVNAYSVIESSEIGDGVVITPQVFVGAGSKIGRGTIIQPGARIMYGANVGEFCNIGPNCVVGMNETVRYKTTIQNLP